MMVSTLRTPCAADQLLIEEVRQHEVLYACPTKSNKDNQLRDTAWQEIADAVGKSGQLIFLFTFLSLTALMRGGGGRYRHRPDTHTHLTSLFFVVVYETLVVDS
jgi:hypothetical protein